MGVYLSLSVFTDHYYPDNKIETVPVNKYSW